MKKTLLSMKRQENSQLSFRLVFIVLLTFFGVFGFAQINKLDHRFEILLNNKDKLARGEKIPSLEQIENKLDQQLVVTPQGAKTMFSAIIYTSNTQKIKDLGILVQSDNKTFVTALVSADDIEKLLLQPEVISIMAPTYDILHNDVSTAQSGASLLHNGVLNNTAYTGKNVLVGIYDSGIDWDHPDFRDPLDPTKSRIYSIWDQTITPIGTETPPSGFNYGVEYTRAMINDELDGTPSNFVRERDTNGHGTHVSATAAGNGAAMANQRHKGFAPEADIIIVKGGNGSFPQTNTINAIAYFQSVATALNKPIVINMSIGGQASAHDGTSAHEIAIDNFTLSAPGRVAVISAGNDYGTNIHRKLEIAPATDGVFSLNVASNTVASTTSIFSFYTYANDNNDFTAKMVAPDGTEYSFPPTATTTHLFGNNAFKVVGYNWISSANGKRYIQFVVTRNTTTTANPVGNYKFYLTNNGATTSIVNGWHVGGDVATTVENGDNEHTVGSPGNATNAITVASYIGRLTWYANGVGAYTTTNNNAEGISSFSAQGPRADGFQKPDIAASGQNVISALSSDSGLAANNSNNIDGTFYRKNQGTSMSSPGVAGAVALLLQANPNLTAAQVKSKLTLNARKDDVTGNSVHPRWGHGKLDIYKTVASEGPCLAPEFETVAYDEQFYISTQDTNATNTNYQFAVKMTPKFTGNVGGVSFYTGSGAVTAMNIQVQLRNVDANGNPGEIVGSKTLSLTNDVQRSTWNFVDFSEFGYQAKTGKDFYVVIDAKDGIMSLRRETIAVSGRSSYSTNAGATWQASTADYRIRAVIYENIPQVKALATSNATSNVVINPGYNYLTAGCELLASVEKTATSTISGNVSAKIWVDNAASEYVARRYEITPTDNSTTASGKVTLYFSQAEFDAYNSQNTVKLPTNANDEANKANLLIDKFSGTSSDNSGTPSSYANGFVTIAPDAANVKWNATYNYWEVSFETTGFSGFFLRTSSSTLATANTNKKEISVYPNPVKETLNIGAAASDKVSVVIYDLTGKMVKTSTATKINVSNLPKGSYIVEITTGNTTVSKKIIKE